MANLFAEYTLDFKPKAECSFELGFVPFSRKISL